MAKLPKALRRLNRQVLEAVLDSPTRDDDRFEIVFVDWFLRKMGFRKLVDEYGQPIVSLAQVSQTVHDFPLFMRIRRIPKALDGVTAANLLGNFSHSKIVREYDLEMADAIAAKEIRKNSYFGLVFPWAGTRYAILHNWDDFDISNPPMVKGRKPYVRTVLTRRLPRKDVGETLFLEPVQQLIDSLSASNRW